MTDLDPLALSRAVGETATAVRAWLRRLREGQGFDGSPFARAPETSSRTTYQSVLELPVSDPLRAPLARWIYRLAEIRINGGARVEVENQRRRVAHVVDVPEHSRWTPAELLARALAEPARRDGWLAAYADSASAVGEATRIYWERRAEIGRRMGDAALADVEAPSDDVAGHATAWLDATDDAFAEHRHERLESTVTAALGSDASSGWPARISPQSLSDLFRDTDLLRGVALDPGRLPQAIGGSSFARALRRVGASWVDATSAEDQPFVIANDAYGLERRTVGALFGLLPMLDAFAQRRLDLGKEAMASHRRAMARVALYESRTLALKVLLHEAALAGAGELTATFEEAVARALGPPVPPRLAGSLFRLHDDDLQRFSGTLLGASRHEALRDAHDDDWFRNPRATEQLRDEASLPPTTRVDDDRLSAGRAALARIALEPLG